MIAPRLVVVLLLLAAAPVRGQRAHLPSPDVILHRMLARYDGARTWEGEVSTRNVTRTQATKTTIHAAAESGPDGRIRRSRVEITSSDNAGGTLIRVDDGKTLWTYVPQINRYGRDARRPDRLSNMFRPFLASALRSAPRLKTSMSRIKGRPVFALSGRGKGHGSLTIYVDATTYALVSASGVGQSGETIMLEVSSEHVNRPLPAAMFQFGVPPNASPLPKERPGGIYGKRPGGLL